MLSRRTSGAEGADPLVPVECGIDVANTVPDAKLLIIEGMGHALPISMWPRIVDGIAEHAARTEVKPPMGPDHTVASMVTQANGEEP